MTSHNLRPPDEDEPVNCAVALVAGEKFYYGRGVRSGDWFIALPLDTDPESAEMLKGGIEAALEEEERIFFHPYGPAMVRLDWLASSEEFPEDKELAQKLKNAFWRGAVRSRATKAGF
jgi:hypothetical protein